MASEAKFTFGEALLVLPVSAVMVALMMVIMLPFALLVTYVRLQLWQWFAMPYLHLPALPFWAVYGLSLIVGTYYVAPAKTSDYKPTMKDSMLSLSASTGGHLLAWLLGYIVHVYLLK